MEVKVDDKFNIAIPDGMREEAEIEAGQRFKVEISGKEITLIPIYPAHELRGIFKGMDIEGYREDEDRV